ncbi:coenzyme F430 synthase [Methanotorris igneus]|uniref:Mur ligase middle domain protein n=1 Tax=Methanotorris igneus (strain DSM 5666 / JCM 11834 / Kol 5) TaxID=880724 RepID=F6BB39_METIK|nr:coenzyme F430 synthase [Methanotorris igneus]AEF95924.1 Mur ligase middle domain protein [Methanotorris igneus Kol 5]
MLIVDVNHGALDLAREYIELGYSVDVWDIYGKLEKDKDFAKNYKDIISKVKIIKKDENINFDNYDKIIAPIHCPIEDDFISFHDAVSEIVKEKYGNIHKKFIEVTGVKGKTTTTEMINFILKDDYEVFLHNSNKGSIAPTSILNVLRECNVDDIDYFIFEVSLGITSCGYGVITNIVENYPIAKGKRNALIAKISTLKNADKKYINMKILEEYGLKLNLENLFVIDTNKEIISKYPLKYKFDDYIVEFNKNVFGMHLVENSIFAIKVCENFINTEDIIEKIKNFRINSRMSVEKIKNRYIVKNINPGLDVKAIDYAIKDFLEVFGVKQNPSEPHIKDVVIIGGDFGITCEEIDVKRLAKVIEKYNANFIFVGDIGKELKKNLDKYPFYSKIDLDELDGNVLVIIRSAIS